MYPTTSQKPSKITTSPDNPALDQQLFIIMFSSFTADLDKKMSLSLIKTWKGGTYRN